MSDTDTMKTTGSDYSTLTRLRNNINELDNLIDDLDIQERQSTQTQNQVTINQEHFNTTQLSSELVQNTNIASSSLSQVALQSEYETERESSVEILTAGMEESDRMSVEPTLPPLPEPSMLEEQEAAVEPPDNQLEIATNSKMLQCVVWIPQKLPVSRFYKDFEQVFELLY